MHNSYNQFLFHSFLSAVHVSNESSRSSAGARHNILYYTVWYNRYNRAYNNSNTAYYAVLLKHVEQTKNCGIKIDYKNCASRWLLTHCNMMHGTHNVKVVRNNRCSENHTKHKCTV